jgi:hypothetical protein
MLSQKKTQPIQLHYGDDSKVVVVPEDEDRFVTSCQEAANACRAYNEQAMFYKQFDDRLLPLLGQWVHQHAAQASKAYLTVREDGLLFVVVLRSTHYDRVVEDALTELDVRVATSAELDMIAMDVLAVPAASQRAYTSFLTPDKTLVYHAPQE